MGKVHTGKIVTFSSNTASRRTWEQCEPAMYIAERNELDR